MILMYKNFMANATATVEDYLKRIYLEGGSTGGDLVPMGRLARSMPVAPGTATSMVKSLLADKLVQYEPYAGVRLTRSGQRIALSILRRHRIIELFLVKTLGMDWSEVHTEAEQLEHAVSERVLRRMDDILGRPGIDPHGDPIPGADGSVEHRPLEPLDSLPDDAGGRVARVMDQSPEFLRAVGRLGLTPGREIQVIGRDAEARTVSVQVGSRRKIVVAAEVAARILVES